MGGDTHGGNIDSVDTSPDVTDVSSDADNAVPADIPADIPEDVPDSGKHDSASAASPDIKEETPEDIPEDTTADTHKDATVDEPEDVAEDTSINKAQDSPENQEKKEPLAEQSEKEPTLRDDIKNNPDFIDENGDVKWPPNDGFEGEPHKATLPTGELVDRFGSEDSAFVAPMGTPYEKRGLPFDMASREYHAYQVEKPLDVLQGPIAPAFHQSGGGMQEKLPESAGDLVDKGFLKRI